MAEKPLALREIQEASIPILLEFDAICKQEGLQYFLIYGTLLGAIRHNGFIPWDDDIDVAMPRKDFDRFVAYMDSHVDTHKPFSLCTRMNTKGYSYSIPRLVDTRYRWEPAFSYERQIELGAFIDIYPVDSCGNSVEEGKRLGKTVKRMNDLFIIYRNPDNGKHNWKTLAKYLISFGLHVIWGNHYDYEKHFARWRKKHTSDSDRYVAILFDCLPIERKLIETTASHVFEGHQVSIPENYDAILRRRFGDYMQLPPEEDRVPHHSYRLYRKEELT